jgi:hypothetical protein
VESTQENGSPAREIPPEETPGPDASGKGFSFWKPVQPSFPEPKPVPRWMVVAGVCVLFGLPVLLIAASFSPRLPDLGLADHWAAALDLAAALALVFCAGAAIRAFVLSPVSGGCGAALRRFGARARRWYAAGPNRSVWTYLVLVGLWAFAFQLPRLSDLRALVFAGTFVFCLAASFALFTAGLMVIAGKERAAEKTSTEGDEGPVRVAGEEAGSDSDGGETA